jgi:hypothetical protein
MKLFAAAAIAALFATSTTLAQSSGNFTARVQTTQCTMNTTPGVDGISGSLDNHSGGKMLTTTIKTPSSSQTTLLITPSLVTGLFTNTEVTQTMTTSAQTAAVTVTVKLDGNPVAPATSLSPSIIYDQRFQQLSAPFFIKLSECTANQNCSMGSYYQHSGGAQFRLRCAAGRRRHAYSRSLVGIHMQRYRHW